MRSYMVTLEAKFTTMLDAETEAAAKSQALALRWPSIPDATWIRGITRIEDTPSEAPPELPQHERQEMDDSMATLTRLYDRLGFNDLLAHLQTVLMRKRHEIGAGPVAVGDVEREIARLRKAQRLLSDEERKAVRAQSVWWTPTQDASEEQLG